MDVVLYLHAVLSSALNKVSDNCTPRPLSPPEKEPSRSQWSRGLRRRSTAEGLLRSWVRIPPGAWMFVSCECLCCQVEVAATGRSLVQRSPTDCGVCLSVIK